jgi:hypothetical protein
MKYAAGEELLKLRMSARTINIVLTKTEEQKRGCEEETGRYTCTIARTARTAGTTTEIINQPSKTRST